MKNLERSLKNRGFILPIVLFLIFILMWLFSIVLLSYKNEISIYNSLRSSNESYWFAENLSTVGEYEVFKGEKSIKNGEYNDIIEYFEDRDLIWKEVNKISKSGYRRYEIKHNGTYIDEVVEMIPFMRNVLEIKLIKEIEIENRVVNIKVLLYYEYSMGEMDIFKSYKREIRGVEVSLKK